MAGDDRGADSRRPEGASGCQRLSQDEEGLEQGQERKGVEMAGQWDGTTQLSPAERKGWGALKHCHQKCWGWENGDLSHWGGQMPQDPGLAKCPHLAQYDGPASKLGPQVKFEYNTCSATTIQKLVGVKPEE
ncbi:hypothetical protein CONPUDRAFT_76344 [Coniophora puteana RWD-64-598 SS2]|uniref:Uncharacterized protein n=1 Tax=Coniophora puteana (strain RWD-64-598) TaxID=741705 RepID=A0A5M3MBX9_CONPW|nr:uncharacterized protein CONPUDRAFT_76344 [Coniophora puteana RWD-64-598 SS2]EIW76749.1 hypothetical protein CONPUDRAFT_76344 [Coniophora puteana RWD-64-598 SS2]